MRVRRQTVEILVGSAVFVFGALFLVIAFRGGDGVGRAGYTLSAKFRQVDGLGVGSEVVLAGIKVGEVTQLRFDSSENRAVVDMRISADLKLPEDSSAQVVTDGLLGPKFVKIVPGGLEETLQPGSRFLYVQDGVIVERLLEKLVANAEAQRRARIEAMKKCDCPAPRRR